MTAAKEISDEFLECRLGHLFTLITDESHIPHRPSADKWGREIWHRCIRCRMHRVVRIDSRGVIAGRAYLAPEGYRMKAVEVPSKNDLRLEVVRRFMGVRPNQIKSRPVTPARNLKAV